MMNVQNPNGAVFAFRINSTSLASPVISFSDICSYSFPFWPIIMFFTTCPKPVVFSPINFRASFVSTFIRATYRFIRRDNQKFFFTNRTYFFYFFYPKWVIFTHSFYTKCPCLTLFRTVARFTAVCCLCKKLCCCVFFFAYFANKFNRAVFALIIPFTFSTAKLTVFSRGLKAHLFVTMLTKSCNSFALWIRCAFWGTGYSFTPKFLATGDTNFWWVFCIFFSVCSIVAKSRTEFTCFYSMLFNFIGFAAFLANFFVQCRHVITNKNTLLTFRKCCLDNAKSKGYQSTNYIAVYCIV